jgi:hypothetical protein
MPRVQAAWEAFMGLRTIKIGEREAAELACDNVAQPPVLYGIRLVCVAPGQGSIMVEHEKADHRGKVVMFAIHVDG